jgi:hypothetical protein
MFFIHSSGGINWRQMGDEQGYLQPEWICRIRNMSGIRPSFKLSIAEVFNYARMDCESWKSSSYQDISWLALDVMILINALSYLLGWDLKSPAFTILGLVLIVIGARTARKSSWI